MRPKQKRSTVVSVEEEVLMVAFRKHTLLLFSLDDCPYALQDAITENQLLNCEIFCLDGTLA
jgi:hypothetical protein